MESKKQSNYLAFILRLKTGNLIILVSRDHDDS